MTKANSEYFELDMSSSDSTENYFGIDETNDSSRRAVARKLGAVVEGGISVSELELIRAKQEGTVKKTNSDLPIQEISTLTFFLHDSFHVFLKTLDMDDLWDTYPVELYEKDGKTRIPNYHHGLIVKQHVGFVEPPWTIPCLPGDVSYPYLPGHPLYGSKVPDNRGTWFKEDELKDDRLFCINVGPPTFRKDIKEKIEAAFPNGLSWKNLRDA